LSVIERNVPMATKPLSRQLCLSVTSICLQGIVAVCFFMVSLYVASLLLQPLQLVGITSIPPGIAHYNYKDKSVEDVNFRF